LTITETWGDGTFVGLTGLEIVDTNDADCSIHSYHGVPRDITTLSQHKNNVQTLDK
jgi:hypothetical protein